MRKFLVAAVALLAFAYLMHQQEQATKPTDLSDGSGGTAGVPGGVQNIPKASTVPRPPTANADDSVPAVPNVGHDHGAMTSSTSNSLTSTTTSATTTTTEPPLEDPPAGADEDNLDDGSAGDGGHEHPQVGMQRPTFPPDDGSVPASPEGMVAYSEITIRGDEQLVPSKGVRSGSGTLDDPYVITGNHVSGRLSIQDTDACIVVKENYIDGQLALNWNGQCLHVHHNFIRDLRVNENILRSGYATGGLVEANRINIVGQLRHYDGEFRGNVVGPRRDTDLLTPIVSEAPFLFVTDTRVLNVDGFNQGLLHHNTFYGSVDLDFHGHHHGTGFFAPHSHYHGSDPFRLAMHAGEDHTKRWTSVAFTDNRIVDPDGYGLRYNDGAHQADDTTATSETPTMLNLAHQHFTDVVLARNVVDGAPVTIDVFNADSTNHTSRNPGTLAVVGNAVHLADPRGVVDLCAARFGPAYDPWTAINIRRIKEVAMMVVANQVHYEPRQLEVGADPIPVLLDEVRSCPLEDAPDSIGIAFMGVRDSTLDIADNVGRGFDYGVKVQQLDNRTAWRVVGNDFGDATHPLWYDTTVHARPETHA